VKSCVGTKFSSRFGDQIATMALDAVSKVVVVNPISQKKEIDIKRFVRIEKVPGSFLEESRVVNGIVLNKDVVHEHMKRRLLNPRILLLDCGLEYKKAESATSVQVEKEEDFERMLKIEEEAIKVMCDQIIAARPNLVFTEKGVSDLAQHYLVRADISVIRRLRKTDNDRIARAVGATIVNETLEIKESDIGKRCGLFEIRQIGDEYFTYLEECKDPKACTVLLRGGSKDILNEIDRNLQDAMAVVRNILMDPRIVPGGGATEMAVSRYLMEKSKTIESRDQYPYRAVAAAFEVIPRTLIENCGGSVIRLMTSLRAEHASAGSSSKQPKIAEKDSALTTEVKARIAEKETKTRANAASAAATASASVALTAACKDCGKGDACWLGIDGNKGVVADMKQLCVVEPLLVKSQTYKTALEAACMLLRIDDIVSGIKKRGGQGGQRSESADADTFGDNRDG